MWTLFMITATVLATSALASTLVIGACMASAQFTARAEGRR